MSNIENMGTVITSDVLVVGGGSGGLVAALKAKEAGANVLVVDKYAIGHSSQGTKSGHGLLAMDPKVDDKDRFMEEQIKTNPQGQYLNDQEMLEGLTDELFTYLYEIKDLGVKIPCNPDGTLALHKHYPEATSSNCNVDIDYVKDLAASCRKAGVRTKDRVTVFDLLRSGDRVVGALGFSTETLEFYIFRAKAVIIANAAFSYCPGGMFYSAADAMIACYNVGAEFCNAEQCTYVDLTYRNTHNYIYWLQNHIYNGKGENIAEKYGCVNPEEITPEHVIGMSKEIAAGNLPIYCDFEKLGFNPGDNMGLLLPRKVEWLRWTGAHSVPPDSKAEVSVDLKTLTQSLRVNQEMQTAVNGLYAIGSCCMYGCSYGGWVHGDGIGFAWRGGLRAGRAAGSYAAGQDFGEIDAEVVRASKAVLMAPTERKRGLNPTDLMNEIGMIILDPKYTILKTEESMVECLERLGEIKGKLDLMSAPTGVDAPHFVGKAVEVRSAISIMEIIMAACRERKESRGAHIRADYPERDDENWLKWVVVSKGADGGPAVRVEPIPFERYRFKPEGWEPKVA